MNLKSTFSVLIVAASFMGMVESANAIVTCCRDFPLSDSYSGCEKRSIPGSGTCDNGFVSGFCLVGVCESRLAADESVEPTFADTFYGYRGSSNMSGSGRTVSAKARLDACWLGGYSVTNGLSSASDCYTACEGANNEACNGLTGADSCTSRCDAISW